MSDTVAVFVAAAAGFLYLCIESGSRRGAVWMAAGGVVSAGMAAALWIGGVH